MSGEITTIRLPEKDLAMMEHFVESGEFCNKSDLIRYAIKKIICELMLKELQESLGKKKMTESEMAKEREKILADIHEIRKGLWREYAKHIP